MPIGLTQKNQLLVKIIRVWFNKYVMFLWIAIGTLFLSAAFTFCTKSIDLSSDTNLYVAISIVCLVFGLMCFYRASIRIRKEENKEREYRKSMEEEAQAREERDKMRFEQEKKLWFEVRLITPESKIEKQVENNQTNNSIDSSESNR